MSSKSNTEVIIGGKVYTLSGYEGEEYLQKVASYINSKLSEIQSSESFRRYSSDMKAIMIQLNLADDYFKAKSRIQKLEEELEQKDRDLYDARHDLVTTQVRYENLEKEMRELEQRDRDLQVQKAKLETSLEDAIQKKTSSESM